MYHCDSRFFKHIDNLNDTLVFVFAVDFNLVLCFTVFDYYSFFFEKNLIFPLFFPTQSIIDFYGVVEIDLPVRKY
jgi:hypothetical protein